MNFEVLENTTIDGNTKVLAADLILCDSFYSTWIENQASIEIVKTLVEEDTKVWSNELNDQKKAIYNM